MSIIRKHLTCYEPSEDTATCAFFIPMGFYDENKKSLAHLTEHCLLAITKAVFLPQPRHKPEFLLFNAMTTSYYTCVWFTAPINTYRGLYKLFIEAITKIPDNVHLINDALLEHEKNKISYELQYLKKLNKRERQFENLELLESTGLSSLTECDVKSAIQEYIQKGGILIEYGGVKEFSGAHYRGLVNYPQIHLIDNCRIAFTHVASLEHIHAARFIAYVANKEGIPVQVKQHIDKSMLLVFPKQVQGTIRIFEKLTRTQFQYYLEDYYAHERKDCSDNVQFIKRLYKYYRQTECICNRKQWYSAICNMSEICKKILSYMKEIENEY